KVVATPSKAIDDRIRWWPTGGGSNGWRRSSPSAIGHRPAEDELIASGAPAPARHQSLDREAALLIEVRDLLGRGRFERIAADPLELIVPPAHAPQLVVMQVTGQRVAQSHEVLHESARGMERHRCAGQQPLQ